MDNMDSLFYKIVHGKGFIPHTSKFTGVGPGKRSWENMFLDVEIELAATLEDWFQDEFKTYFRKWSASIFDIIIVQTDEDDVSFGYVSMKSVILPFISKYISTSNKGTRYRIFFFNELKPSQFNPDIYDYDAEIEKLVEKGIWDVS